MIRDYLKTREALILAGLAIVAVISGWVQAGGRLDQTVGGTRGTITWELPKIQASDPGAAMRQLTAQSIWGPLAKGNTASKTAKTTVPQESWKLLGIVAEENGLYALMKPGKTAIATLLGPGDSLPDGSVIETLDKVSVTTVKEGKVTVHRLFGGNG